MAITPRQWEQFFRFRSQGWSRAAAARECGISYNSAKAKEKGLKHDNGQAYRDARAEEKLPQVKPYDELSERAQRAWHDFDFFRRTYIGHISTPWQIETAENVVKLLATPTKEFVVENVAPGVGKTTLAHDIAAWVTVRDRRIRGLFGSRTENNARRQVRRLKRTLERTTPAKARSELVERGLAVDAVATLAEDFGLFKPTTQDVWKADEFVVAQLDDVAVEEKEPTWSSYGMDSAVMGNRFNIIFWDDVVDKATLRTMEAVEAQRTWWDDEAETRLEPGGVLFLIGQRLSPIDLYRYALDKVVPADDEDDEDADPDEPVEERPKLYTHIVYRAHDEDRCVGRENHRSDSPAWPEGCLLDPFRLPWRDLRAIEATKRRNYLVSYQQQDVDPEEVLVPDVWIWGGTDSDGSIAPGCMDEHRDICQLPANLVPPLFSMASVDPSGKKMWATEWFIHAPEASNQSFLMDLERKAMTADELLDWDADSGTFKGLMEDWQARSVALGYPITHWIVEVNAAQRYLLAYDHVRRWMAKWGVAIIPHTTGPRKLDEDHGPWILRDHFRHGRVRLPGKQATGARLKSLKLIDEVTRWPNPGGTDDCVMCMWFQFIHLPQIAVVDAGRNRLRRPSWMRRHDAPRMPSRV